MAGELCSCGSGLASAWERRHRISAAPRLVLDRRRLQILAAASPGSKRKTRGKKDDSDLKSKSYTDEEVYNISRGWKIKAEPNEKVVEMAGLKFPASLNKLSDQDKAPLLEPRTVHKLLRVMGGKNNGKKLLSPNDSSVRPMMEVVRGAVFNMLQARGGYTGGLPPGKWLDLYSGTGSVGIEALSRGCLAAHFIEMDPWVISKVLKPNLEATNYTEQSVVHMLKVETYLEKQATNPKAEVFDYISVTPPYEAVHYPTLMEQLSTSPLVGDYTYVIVEYPLKSKQEMPEACGPLAKIVDRRYGRTHLAVYGPNP
ncbi:uncharacterized protein LOC9639054 [Selaginella moellendorffii]|nr:uncharacterized protein LOC9639054 [Selaginella moellendorffii]|eukprot:XP_002977141.2 uncharacterized protein LOC9639054 [Selaginella moellendorffii]